MRKMKVNLGIKGTLMKLEVGESIQVPNNIYPIASVRTVASRLRAEGCDIRVSAKKGTNYSIATKNS